MKLNISTKKDGKWYTIAKIEVNKFGKLQLSGKVENMMALLNQVKSEGKEWFNIPVFDQSDKEDRHPTAHETAKSNGYAPKPANDFVDSDEIPF